MKSEDKYIVDPTSDFFINFLKSLAGILGFGNVQIKNKILLFCSIYKINSGQAREAITLLDQIKNTLGPMEIARLTSQAVAFLLLNEMKNSEHSLRMLEAKTNEVPQSFAASALVTELCFIIDKAPNRALSNLDVTFSQLGYIDTDQFYRVLEEIIDSGQPAVLTDSDDDQQVPWKGKLDIQRHPTCIIQPELIRAQKSLFRGFELLMMKNQTLARRMFQQTLHFTPESIFALVAEKMLHELRDTLGPYR